VAFNKEGSERITATISQVAHQITKTNCCFTCALITLYLLQSKPMKKNHMQKKDIFDLVYCIAYKVVVLLFGFANIMGHIWTQSAPVFILGHALVYLFLSVLLFFLPRKDKQTGQVLVYAIALGNALMFCPFFNNGYFESGFLSIAGDMILYIPLTLFLVYYDLRVSLPKYRDAGKE
jgi:hypothetical protein